MKLHMRGVELMVELMEAADNIERMDLNDVRSLLKETASVLGDLLARDLPSKGQNDDQISN